MSSPLPHKIQGGSPTKDVEVPSVIRKLYEGIDRDPKMSAIKTFRGVVGVENDQLSWELYTFDADGQIVSNHKFEDRDVYAAVAKFFVKMGFKL
jgi:hypothetical protein